MSGWVDRPSNRRASLPANWQMIRNVVFRRDKRVCQIKGPRCTEVATEIDHLGARTDHRPQVLQAVCKTCHATKTGQQGNAARKPRPSRKRPPESHPGLR